ncbi:uncharacterized protein LOC134192856 [Corticium candelabrum]|uniref:uncharacterized protein LOC134192856 n=1 Tax=Corticium candelabrum TaxID=121492 RepID=UPI002E2558B7|nr:uncharacterized protein LOC134192856 [Corticium candelabrum]
MHADFAELSGRQYLLMIDSFLKWKEVHKLDTHATTEKTMNAMKLAFSYHGLPRRLVTETIPQFRLHEFQIFMKANGIRNQLTPPYHPSFNKQAERLPRTQENFEQSANREIHHSSGIIILTAVSNDTKHDNREGPSGAHVEDRIEN